PQGAARNAFRRSLAQSANDRLQTTSRSSVDRSQMPHRKTAPVGEDLGDPAAMASPPIGLVAQQASRGALGDFGRLLQGQLGFGAGQPILDDAPEPVPLPRSAGHPPLGRRAERAEPDIIDAGLLERRRQLPLRKPRPARDRPSRTSISAATPAADSAATTSASRAFS